MSDSKLWLWIWKLREFWARDQFGCQHWQIGLNMIVQGEGRKGREESQRWNAGVRKRSPQWSKMEWSQRWKANQKSSVTAIKGKDNFRRIDLINSDNCLEETEIRHLAGWR